MAVVIAIVCAVVGTFFGALAGGVIGVEFASSSARPESTSGFDHGFVVGAVVGCCAGIAGFIVVRRRRQRTTLHVRDLTPDEARRAFRVRMGMRHGAFLAMAVSYVFFLSLRNERSWGTAWFMALNAIGLIGFIVASRCPACSRFLSTASIRNRRCEQCETRFDA